MRHHPRIRRSASALIATLSIGAAASVSAAPAHGGGPSLEHLDAQNWTCVPFAPANRWSCFNDGAGRPFPGNPQPAPSYTFLGFDMSSGDLLYTGHLVRGDLYRGQPCAGTGAPYVYRALIDYYECTRG